jgi:SNF2 family DNA or RNA helicase
VIELFPHQDKGFQYLTERGGGCLFWKMRTGKTLTALFAAFTSKTLPMLILTKSSIMETFRKALVEDMNIKPEKVGVCYNRYPKHKREKILAGHQFVICNYEAAIPLRVMGAQAWGSIIFDESFALANIESKVTRYIERHVKKQKEGQVRIALTGTPASESPRQYASQFFIVDGHYMGYDNIHSYMSDEWIPAGRHNKLQPAREEHLAEIRDYVQANSSVLSLEDLGKGSEILFNQRFVAMNEKQEEALRWAENRREELNNLHYLLGGDAGVGDLVYVNYANMVGAGINPVTREVINFAKINDVLNCYLDNQEPMLVLSWFVDVLPVATEIFRKAGVRCQYIDGTVIKTEAEEIRSRFQDGELDVVFAHSSVASEGLDFSRADVTYYLSNSFSLNLREQTVMRTTNINKTNPVEIIDVCTVDSMDKDIVKKLNKKEELSNSFLKKICPIK